MPTHRQSLTAIRARSVRNKSVGTSYHEPTLCYFRVGTTSADGGHSVEILISLSISKEQNIRSTEQCTIIARVPTPDVH